jgi:hypothetical protein
MRIGEVGELEIMLPSPRAWPGLDKRMAEVLVPASKMELTSIGLEVYFSFLW